ncbi:hypothetical protein M2132_000495 [Dysgonomonas sp. PH5-45]|nr:hypothetical protein [Dysgonomonas sp. PH5-45]MDH6386976.1 hypothetical protein [Dysgonomonas sp. PH5-37]
MYSFVENLVISFALLERKRASHKMPLAQFILLLSFFTQKAYILVFSCNRTYRHILSLCRTSKAKAISSKILIPNINNKPTPRRIRGVPVFYLPFILFDSI